MRTPPVASRSPAAPYTPETTVSPLLQKLMKSPRSAGSYGCTREIYHPLSPKAEPLAHLFYDSDNDDEESDVEDNTNSPLRGHARSQSAAQQPMRSSPLNPKARAREPFVIRPSNVGSKCEGTVKPKLLEAASLTGNKNLKDKVQPQDKAEAEAALTPAAALKTPPSRKRSSPPPEDLEDRHEEGGTPSSPTKRYRISKDSTFGRILDYGEQSASSDESGSEKEADKLSTSLPGSFSLEFTGASPDPMKTATPSRSRQPDIQDLPLQETPIRYQPGLAVSPRVVPLPESPEDSPASSRAQSPPSMADLYAAETQKPRVSHGRRRNPAAEHVEAVANKLRILNIKAQHYSEAVTYSAEDKETIREIEKIYTSKDRFDPVELTRLEDTYQARIKALCDQERERLHKIDVAEQARREEERRAREAEAARLAAEELRRRQEEEERQRRLREAEEQKRREQETARLEAERQRAEVERQKAEEAARSAAAAKAETERKQAEKVAAERASQQPLVPGRISQEAELLASEKIIKNLKQLRKAVEDNEDMRKAFKFTSICRDIRPKIGQLTGERQQTLQAREHIKRVLMELKNAQGPRVSAGNFMFTPFPTGQDVEIPVAFVYVVNQIAKMVVLQLDQEAGTRPQCADPIGVVIASTFADPQFGVNGKTFVDIFVARLFKRNPLLVGQIGPETTDDDLRRLGWLYDYKNSVFEGLEKHANRMQGLVAGYAAIAGRDFRASKLVNPYPMYHLWNKLAMFMNTPTDKLTNTHYYCMTVMLQRSAPKLVSVYGAQAAKMINAIVGPWAHIGEQNGHTGAGQLIAWGVNWKLGKA